MPVTAGIWIRQTIDCDPCGMTLSFKYRSHGNGSPTNICRASIKDVDDAWHNNMSKILENEEGNWKSESIENINFSASRIWIEFKAIALSGTLPHWQNLDVDDIKIE